MNSELLKVVLDRAERLFSFSIDFALNMRCKTDATANQRPVVSEDESWEVISQGEIRQKDLLYRLDQATHHVLPKELSLLAETIRQFRRILADVRQCRRSAVQLTRILELVAQFEELGRKGGSCILEIRKSLANQRIDVERNLDRSSITPAAMTASLNVAQALKGVVQEQRLKLMVDIFGMPE
ncbi:hypothetical protein ETAA8_64960 [Anatilimnocola aggregata]|uniref:Uncharacterized protein n=1 Tax=Anatilimnocola aggregata TaxID=2528021 RepID=A0A517YM94_9BACT|nr:hypothetical protein [Anatilimnocola aggregata]QDU31342.1 hypothetical protein ETAA8_64960 [Anatilimnocola aggregata]